jgi:SAM-dependent methyltransferase
MLDCGQFVVPHVICPKCLSHERHRLLHLYLTREDPDFFKRGDVVLHFAPERHIRDLVDANAGYRCYSTDFSRLPIQGNAGTAFQSDMQRLPVRDDAFGVIFCLHVLEHVPDDRKGILELYRVLKKGGVAYIMVPFMMGWEKTEEFGAPDPAIFDHVRGYAPGDFSDRLIPFEFEEVAAPGFLSREEVRRYRIPGDSQVIYRCTKG